MKIGEGKEKLSRGSPPRYPFPYPNLPARIAPTPSNSQIFDFIESLSPDRLVGVRRGEQLFLIQDRKGEVIRPRLPFFLS